MRTLQQRLQLDSVDESLLARALTHCSTGEAEHMERLEFLGDAVLGLVVAEYLHRHFPDDTEGRLSRLRAHLVRKESLLNIARRWQLAEVLRVGDGERDVRGGLKSMSIAANAVEAIIGAVFKSSGFEAARRLILREWQPLFTDAQALDAIDAKSRLQEWTQGHGQGLPVYEVEDMGVQRTPRFVARCRVAGKLMGEGRGQRKKQAETEAARAAIQSLGIKI